MENTKDSTPSRSVKIVLQGNDYIVKFPNVGQFIDIESKKALFSNRQYSALVTSNLVNSNHALDLIDAIAYFSTLIPELQKDLKLANLFELDMLSAKELTDQYQKVFRPWFLKWREVLEIGAKDNGDEEE